MREHECYRVLSVGTGASLEEIQASYRRLVKRFHPDLTGRASDGPRLARVVDAYRTLQIALAKSSNERATRREATGFRSPPWTSAGQSGSGAGLSMSDLGKLVTSGRRPETRAFAVARLANTGRRSAYGWIRVALFDESRVVVEAAIDAIGRLGVLQSAGELAVVFAGGDAVIRRRILRTLAQLPDLRPFRSIILSAMQEGPGSTRREGLQLFRRLKTAESADPAHQA